MLRISKTPRSCHSCCGEPTTGRLQAGILVPLFSGDSRLGLTTVEICGPVRASVIRDLGEKNTAHIWINLSQILLGDRDKNSSLSTCFESFCWELQAQFQNPPFLYYVGGSNKLDYRILYSSVLNIREIMIIQLIWILFYFVKAKNYSNISFFKENNKKMV